MIIGQKLDNEEKICDIDEKRSLVLTLERRDSRTIIQWQYMKTQSYLGNYKLIKLIGYNFHPQDGQAYTTRDKFLEK